MLSALFVVAYTGISLPVIGVGLLSDALDLERAGLAFIGCMLLLVSAAGAYLLRRPATTERT